MKTEKMTQPQKTVLNDDERRRMIELSAYLLAESRGFAGDRPEQDWYEAEAAVDHMLNLAD